MVCRRRVSLNIDENIGLQVTRYVRPTEYILTDTASIYSGVADSLYTPSTHAYRNKRCYIGLYVTRLGIFSAYVMFKSILNKFDALKNVLRMGLLKRCQSLAATTQKSLR